MKLQDRVALVTGAARRVGRAIALQLADAGCDVAVHCHRSTAEANEVAGRVRAAGRRAAVLTADLSDLSAAERLPERVAAEFGRLDVLINNASVFEPAALEQADAAAWERTLRINAIAPALLIRSAAPHLRAGGRGRVVNLTDIAAERPWRGYVPYCASKAALASLTAGMAEALAPHVLVNAIAPGVAEFPEHFDEARRKRILERVPLQRAGTPADIAAAVLFLVRDADYMTGVTLAVDGGRSIAW